MLKVKNYISQGYESEVTWKVNWKGLQPNKKDDPLEQDYQSPKTDGGRQTIDDMSLISGTYGDYEVTRTGNSVGTIEVNGINLDLLNDREQEDVFEDHGAFLMQTLDEGVDDNSQFLKPTIPANMTAYLGGLKKRYLTLQKEQPAQQSRIQLLTSYTDRFIQVQELKNMITRQHLLIVKAPIRGRGITSLRLAVAHLEEKLDRVKRDLKNALTGFDLTAKALTSQEVQAISKNLISFKGQRGTEVTTLNAILDFFLPKKKGADEEVISTKKQKEGTDFMELIDEDSLHAPFPSSWEQCPTYTQSGENFTRVLVIAGYPKRVYGDWLSELKHKKGVIDVVRYVGSASSNGIVVYYEKTIQGKEAELLNTSDPYKKRVFQNYIDSANMQLDKCLDNPTTFMYQRMLVYLRVNSLVELEDLTDNVKNALVKLQMKPLVLAKTTSQPFWSAIPTGQNLLSEYTYEESNTRVASSMFPFDDTEILNLRPRNDIEGVNRDTNSFVAIDMFDRGKTPNQDMVVIGTSGVRKTTYMIQKILQHATQDYQIYIIDPEDEYTRIVEALGGAVLHLASNAKYRINSLQIFSKEILSADEAVTGPDLLIKDRIQRLKGFFEVLKTGITQVELTILDDVVK